MGSGLLAFGLGSTVRDVGCLVLNVVVGLSWAALYYLAKIITFNTPISKRLTLKVVKL